MFQNGNPPNLIGANRRSSYCPYLIEIIVISNRLGGPKHLH
jgi:hypothetical protein